MLNTVTGIAELRAQVSDWRRDGARIGFVPTMGNLHGGHYGLIDLARQHCDRVVASIFVNPTQFGPNEDFTSYPRTLESDQAGLAAHRCDLLFAPSVEEMYPTGRSGLTEVHLPALSDMLCGAVRPGHFTGVATVVAMLFNMVRPDIAVFGQKDFQQLQVILRMVADLAYGIEIIAAPVEREASGLAMSSRNQYLTAEQRERGAEIFATLQVMATQWRIGMPRVQIEFEANQRLRTAGFVPDYAAIRRTSDLLEPDEGQRDGTVAMIAARLGKARLIDNILL